MRSFNIRGHILAVHRGANAYSSCRHACTSVFPSRRIYAGAESQSAREPKRHMVYCVDDRIEVSFSDIDQMKVQRDPNVCQFQSYTSYSSALNFAQQNFGGQGADCSC